MRYKVLFWILAVLLTIITAYYQRITGPTYPISGEIELNRQEYSFKLPRSHAGNTDCMLMLEIPDTAGNAMLFYRRFPSGDEWNQLTFNRQNGTLIAYLPHQPPAGKLQYYITVTGQSVSKDIAKKDPIIIRFRDDVPALIMIPHIFFMFIAMLLSNVSGLFTLKKLKSFRLYSVLTLIVLFTGGFIFGPIMQKYAFGEFWTGFPLGKDLTDTKTLVAFTGWLIAILLNLKKERPWAVITAAVLLLITYSIPHSLLGS
ncbi:MAG: hypothetical protein HY738_08785 [Bacteroidia bacterium]|nr:hypothetical protein [Bacteroidia bacterium]